MTNKPKNIGTAAETAVVRYARENGFELAERLALAGANDVGDVRLTKIVHLEVKGGKAAESASIPRVAEWMRECDVERINSGAAYCFLIRKRKGMGARNVGLWHAHARLKDLNPAFDGHVGDTVVQMEFRNLLWVLRQGGFGLPLLDN